MFTNSAMRLYRLSSAAAEPGEHQPRDARARARQAQRRRAQVTCSDAEDPDGARTTALQLYRQQ